MEVRRALLTPEQQNILAIWEHFFEGPAWPLIKQRFEGRLPAIDSAYRSVRDLHALGVLQGAERVYDELLGLERALEGEFQVIVGAVETERQEQKEGFGANA